MQYSPAVFVPVEEVSHHTATDGLLTRFQVALPAFSPFTTCSAGVATLMAPGMARRQRSATTTRDAWLLKGSLERATHCKYVKGRFSAGLT